MGYDAHVVAGCVRNYDLPHAWVMVLKDGTEYYLDPTFKKGEDGYPAFWYHERKIWVIFDKGATPAEVRSYNKVIKVYKENIEKMSIARYFENKRNDYAISKYTTEE